MTDCDDTIRQAVQEAVDEMYPATADQLEVEAARLCMIVESAVNEAIANLREIENTTTIPADDSDDPTSAFYNPFAHPPFTD